jgi:two-component system, OmpR family, sensor kinase
VRKRLLFVLLSTVMLALAVSSVGTYELLRRGDRKSEILRLRNTAERLQSLPDVAESLSVTFRALELTSAAIVRFDAVAPSTTRLRYTNESGLQIGSLNEFNVSDADLLAVAAGRTVTRVNMGSTWAVAQVGTTEAGQVEALVLVALLPNTAERVLPWLALGSLSALLLAAGSAFLIAQQFTRPLRVATGAYRRIASGDLTFRIGDRDRSAARNDEVGELLRTLDTMAEALDRARLQERQFLLSVSHDLRTPLTSIRGYAEAVADGAGDPQRSAEVIVNEARRLERLVQDLLDLAKLEARQFTLTPARVDLTDVVTDSADGFLPSAEKANVLLSLDVIDGVYANLDRDRFAQVLANLIENALKYAHKHVSISLHRDSASAHPQVTIGISDDGPGIDHEDLPFVFDRSFTSDRQSTRHIGSGLGLAIVKEIVSAMDGSLRIETGSTGTTFFVTIPALEADKPPSPRP